MLAMSEQLTEVSLFSEDQDFGSLRWSHVEGYTLDLARKIGWNANLRNAKLDDFIADATAHVWKKINDRKINSRAGIYTVIVNYSVSEIRKNNRKKRQPGQPLDEMAENAAGYLPDFNQKQRIDDLAYISPFLTVVACALQADYSLDLIASAFGLSCQQLEIKVRKEQRRIRESVKS
jgi:hypothetical protein